MKTYLVEYYQGQYPDLTKETVEIKAGSEDEAVEILFRNYSDVYQLISIAS